VTRPVALTAFDCPYTVVIHARALTVRARPRAYGNRIVNPSWVK
jgi:hypothetical protein